MGKARDLANLVNGISSNYITFISVNGKHLRLHLDADITTDCVIDIHENGTFAITNKPTNKTLAEFWKDEGF